MRSNQCCCSIFQQTQYVGLLKNHAVYQFSEVKCSQKNQVQFICLQPKCKNLSLHCTKIQCKACYNKHKDCDVIKTLEWSKFFKSRYKSAQQRMRKLFELEQIMISKLLSIKNQSIRIITFDWIEDSQSALLENIFIHKRIQKFTGNDAKQIQKRMKEWIKKQPNLDYIFDRFRCQSQKIIEKYQNLKQTAINHILRGSQVNSDIVKSPSQHQLLNKWLDQPNKIQLIFRASQHNFSAATFHKICDNTPNTLVIAKTEFGKVVGGFTPLIWNFRLGQ